MASSHSAGAAQELGSVWPQSTQPHLGRAEVSLGGPVTPFTSPRLSWPIPVSLEGYCGAEGGSLPFVCDVLPPNPGVPHSHSGPCILHSTPSAS